MGEQYQLILGDCLEVMRGMEAGSVDHVICDPPYDERTHNGAVTERETVVQGGIGHLVNGIDFNHMVDHERVVNEFLRLARRWSLAFCTFEDIRLFRDPAWKCGAWVRAGVWDRVNPAPQFTGDRPSQACDGIAIMHNPNVKKRWNGGGRPGIWRYSVEFGKKLHPTQKPLSLMLQLVEEFTDYGDLIIDPYMGGGSTGVACLMLGRRFIGIERDPVYYEIATRRLIEAAMQPPLFTDAPARVEARQGALFTGETR